jgi:oligopeptide transport system permease protein
MSSAPATSTSPAGAASATASSGRAASLWSDAWRRLRRNRMAVGCGAFLVVLAILCFSAPLIPGLADPNRPDFDLGASPPGVSHWFGTDTLGRDLLARVLYGGRISLLVGFVATLVSLLIGVSYGAISGYLGGRTDEVLMRVVDVLYSLPYVFLVILLLVFFSKSLLMLFVALGLVQWLTMSRIVRGQVLSLKQQTFVEAARALGAGDARIVFVHLVPNTLGPVIVFATLTVPAVMLQEAFLSFLGLGVQPPDSSWGVLIEEGRRMMALFPWMVIFPGLALAATLFAFNFFGDGLRDALDPQSRGEA